MAYDTALVLGSVAVAFIFMYLGTQVQTRHHILQTLFIFGGLILSINAFGVMREVVNIQSLSANMVSVIDQGILVITIVFWAAMAYYLIFYLLEVIEYIKSAALKGKSRGKGK